MSSSSPPANGTTGDEIAFNIPIWMSISAFTAVAWYNVAQLNVSIFMTFKRRRGLYFWSLLISSYGVIFHSLGFLLKLFQLTRNDYLSCTIITIGWWPMVTGQSLVLYSRLHLVVKEQRILRGVLIMIIWNAITLHIPTTVFTYGSSSPAWQQFLLGFQVMEKIQMTIFCIQEFIISGIYMWATVRLLKPVYRRRTRSVMQQLIWINIFIVIMDISLLVMEYLGNYQVEATLKSMVYSIKLTLEFSVLNQLMRLANSNNAYNASVADDEQTPSSKPPRKRRIPLTYLTHLLPHRAPFNDEKHSHVSSPRPIPAGTPVSGSHTHTHTHTLTPAPTNSSYLPSLDRHRPSLQRPSLTLDTGTLQSQRARQGSNASTIITNPAAFVAERRAPRDPYALDGLSPIAATPVVALPEGGGVGLTQRKWGERRGDGWGVGTAGAGVGMGAESPEVSPTTSARPRDSRVPPSPGSRTSRLSGLFALPQRLIGGGGGGQGSEGQSSAEAGGLEPPDPQLLRSHRPSVSDWAGYRADADGQSRSSSEARLDPTERIKRSTRVLEVNREGRGDGDEGDGDEEEIVGEELDDSDEEEWREGVRRSAESGEVGVPQGGLWDDRESMWEMVGKEGADKKVQEWDVRGGESRKAEEGRSGVARGGGHDFMTSAL